MIAYAFLDEADCVTGWGCSASLPEGATPLPPEVPLARAPTLRLVDGVWIERMALPSPDLTPEGDTLTLVWPALPPEARVTVLDADHGEELGVLEPVDGALVLQLEDPGRYEVALTAPPAWLGQRHQIEWRLP